ncbi:hypothetical protein L4D12_15720 [Photobacterium nomapromontoriensis]
MVYVDLNPVRADIAKTLLPFESPRQYAQTFPGYLLLVDETKHAIRDGNKGSISDNACNIDSSLELSAENWWRKTRRLADLTVRLSASNHRCYG